MTLICAFASPSAGFYALSDILVSEKTQAAGPKISLPLRPHPTEIRIGDRVVTACMQKTHIMGRTLLQWSGSVNIAFMIIRKLWDLSNQGAEFVSIDDLFAQAGILPEHLDKNIRLLYWFNSGDSTILKWEWRCLQQAHGDTSLWYEGSGVTSYFWGTQVNRPPNVSEQVFMFSEAISRVSTHFTTESFPNYEFQSAYGGWFELSEKISGTFQKLPYAIFFWAQSSIGSSPHLSHIVFSWYVNFDLVICRIEFTKLGEQTLAKPNLFSIADTLGRPGLGPNEPDPEFAPRFIFHKMLAMDTGEIASLVTPDYDAGGFTASISKEAGIDYNMTPEFYERLVNANVVKSTTWTINSDAIFS